MRDAIARYALPGALVRRCSAKTRVCDRAQESGAMQRNRRLRRCDAAQSRLGGSAFRAILFGSAL